MNATRGNARLSAKSDRARANAAREALTRAVNRAIDNGAPIIVEIPPGTPCAWFARCDRDAVGTTPHPILGAVPTCARCHDFATS